MVEMVEVVEMAEAVVMVWQRLFSYPAISGVSSKEHRAKTVPKIL